MSDADRRIDADEAAGVDVASMPRRSIGNVRSLALVALSARKAPRLPG